MYYYLSIFSEHAIVAARASVMVYDDGNKKWVPSGASQGISKVQIYHHSVNNTFRVVGRKLNDHEVTILVVPYKGCFFPPIILISDGVI